MAWVETQSLQSLACRFISFAPFRCDSHSPDQKSTYMVRAAKRYYIVELNIFFGLWMPNMQKSFVRKSWLQDGALRALCNLSSHRGHLHLQDPLIGSQGAITRDVGEGFPIHNPKAQNGRMRIFTCSIRQKKKAISKTSSMIFHALILLYPKN